MNPFSNTKNDPPISQTKPIYSGAEQDRYGSHFSIGTKGIDKLKEVASYKGLGSEQDRYGSHFSLDQERVRAAAQSMINAKGDGAEQDRHASHFGLGADGLAQARKLAGLQGVGAEQDRYGSHFSWNKDAVQQAAQSIQDTVKQANEKK